MTDRACILGMGESITGVAALCARRDCGGRRLHGIHAHILHRTPPSLHERTQAYEHSMNSTCACPHMRPYTCPDVCPYMCSYMRTQDELDMCGSQKCELGTPPHHHPFSLSAHLALYQEERERERERERKSSNDRMHAGV